jgi:precorrin-6A/cobalt-precorrin-6A reductase
MRVLILGGTSEARTLAELLNGDGRFAAVLSLAGRTAQPAALPIMTRIGGFGGAEGLARYLVEERIAAVVDATHPFAARISTNVVHACAATGVPLGSLVRAPWAFVPGDRWTVVRHIPAAVQALGAAARRVLVTVGRTELSAFAAAPQHSYVARTIDAPEGDLPPNLTLIQARPPFDETAETRLMQEHDIEVVVSKNSGGAEIYGKIAAARALGLPVIMIARPWKPTGKVLGSPAEAYSWLEELLAAHERSSGDSSRRGV